MLKRKSPQIFGLLTASFASLQVRQGNRVLQTALGRSIEFRIGKMNGTQRTLEKSKPVRYTGIRFELRPATEHPAR